jgi:hypothetical protein
VTYFEGLVSEVVCPQQPVQYFIGNQLVETHICGNTEATETGTAEAGVNVMHS